LSLKDTLLAEYQKKNTGSESSQYEMLRSLELSYDTFSEIKQHCDTIGITFLSTPDEAESLDFLVDILDISMIKIGSGEVTNIPFLIQAARKGRPVILSTGMSTLEEVTTAFGVLTEYGAPEITLLHCTSNYPAAIEEVNLNAMLTMNRAFPAAVGYSDHTEGITIPVAAAALGATVIEKHFTLDKTMPGPDHRASLDPKELKEMVEAIRMVEQALGDGKKIPTASEMAVRKLVHKSIVAAKPIKKGEEFTEENLTTKRAGTGIPVENWYQLIGKRATRDYKVDDVIMEP
jgi:N-acetylneuraminate synthase